MVGTSRIARRRADALVFLGDQGGDVQLFIDRIAPVVGAYFAVQPFGRGLGQAIGEGLEHDRTVVVVLRLELGELGLDAQSGRHGEGPGVIPARRDEVGQRLLRLAGRPLLLLAQPVPGEDRLAVYEEFDVLVLAPHREQTEHGVGGDPFFGNQLGQHLLAVLEHIARRFADHGVVEDFRIGAGQVPGLEEGAPVDVLGQRCQIEVVQHRDAELLRLDRRVFELAGIRASGFQRHQRHALLVRVLATDFFVVGGDFGDVVVAHVEREQLGDDADGARGVRHIHHRPGVIRCDLDCGMGARGGRAADQQRDRISVGKALALHFAGDVAHLLQRGRDQAREADGLRAVLLRRMQDLVGRNHDA